MQWRDAQAATIASARLFRKKRRLAKRMAQGFPEDSCSTTAHSNEGSSELWMPRLFAPGKSAWRRGSFLVATSAGNTSLPATVVKIDEADGKREWWLRPAERRAN